ncbi:3',5'-cyclic AMP phosphodiesterase CpdA [Actinomycetospora succinea]|uniref:3',5'-cyclic AMP phosphodiesterase CpdA n=1 Tax=Actinomycetospora succinea TaxID=663603 RepID=A0A4R6V511_9PSEU|nr:metallophosphoesterase [Actinomycetospora succinea]TDQ53938.1 3',5'-cyclic AMP phosphodiesterase CpdA [Actinomycetospora succinea]
MTGGPRLLATSDLHANRSDNEDLVRELHPTHPGDWLIVAGDVGDRVGTVAWALEILAERFAQVIWVPGNHELWTPPGDEVELVGPARYDHLVEVARGLGVLTPEDPWPVWEGDGGPALVCPMFVLYDYSVRPPSIPDDWSNEAALEVAREAGVVCTDEYLMSSDPFPDAAAWCADRLARTEARLAQRPAGMPTVLVNHWPLTPHPTRILRYPEFALWCGTTATADWHKLHDAAVLVYGHLHIPRTTVEDGVRCEEVSVGYPREWQRHGLVRGALREILPGPAGDGPDPFTAWAAEQSATWART